MNWTVVHNNKSVVVFCLLGDSPASEFYVLTFGTLCTSIFIACHDL